MNLQLKMIKSFILIILWISMLIILCSFNYSFNSNAKNNNPVDIKYDNLGRVIEATYADGSIANYTYDKNGNILKVTIERPQDTSEDSTDDNKPDDSDKNNQQSGNNEKTEDVRDKNTNETSNSDKDPQEDSNSSTSEKQNDDGNTNGNGGADNSGNNDGLISNDSVFTDTPIFAVDELGIMNAFKRSMPIIKSVKRSANKEKYFLTVKISKIKKNEVIKKVSFQIKYSPNKNFKKSKVITVNQNEKKKLTSKKFMVKKAKKYYIKARAYTKTKTGKRIYSKYSKVHKIKVAK